MTTYIGRIGGMVPAGCVTDMPMMHEQRVVFGGGEGTLSPRRARVQGPGGRQWPVRVDVDELGAYNAVTSLARRQSLYGGSYRVIPCDALEHNLFAPKATEELHNWTGLSIGPNQSFPTVSPGEAVGASMMGRVSAGNTAASPRVPLPIVRRLWAKAFLAGVGTMTLRYFNSSGTATSYDFPFALPSGQLANFGDTELMFAGHVSAQIAITPAAESPVYFAWPSIAYADNPYTTGRGCDSAYLSMPLHTPDSTWGRGMESVTYEIVEVGA